MKLQLSFDEINDFIKKEVKAVNITLSQANEQTLCVNVSKLIISTNINLSIDKIEGNNIYLTLAGGLAVDNLVKGAIALFKEHLPIWVEPISDTSFVIKLDAIEKAQKILQYLVLKEIQILSNAISTIVDVR